MSRLVVLRGPFTDEELRDIIDVMAAIEARRPDELFEMGLDAEDCNDDVQELLDVINPLRPGYERVVKFWRREPRQRGMI